MAKKEEKKYTPRQARILRGKLQREMAKVLNMSIPSYKSREDGKKDFSMNEANEFCRFLGYELLEIDWTCKG